MKKSAAVFHQTKIFFSSLYSMPAKRYTYWVKNNCRPKSLSPTHHSARAWICLNWNETHSWIFEWIALPNYFLKRWFDNSDARYQYAIAYHFLFLNNRWLAIQNDWTMPQINPNCREKGYWYKKRVLASSSRGNWGLILTIPPNPQGGVVWK